MADPTTALEQFWPQQNLVDIHMGTAWDRPTAPAAAGDPPTSPSGGQTTVYVCVIDNGVQLTHNEINRTGNVGWDLLNAIDITAPLSLVGEGAHATACAGIALAEWGARNGVVGIGPQLRLLSIAVPSPMTAARLVSAIDEARTHTVPNSGAGHRRVILLSGGFQSYTPVEQGNIQTAIDNALSAGIPVIVGNGNGNATTGVAEAPQFPATATGVVAVGAITLSTAGAARANGETAGPGAPSAGGWSSNYDATTQFVVAPGRNIPTTDLVGADGYNTTVTNPNYILTFRGTQAAAAHVAGVAALLVSHNSDLSVDDLRSILARTAEKITAPGGYNVNDANHPLEPGVAANTWNQELGYGRVNADDAVVAARKSKAKVDVTLNGSGHTITYSGVVYISPTISSTAATIRLSHDNPAMASPVTFTLPAPPAHFVWATGTPASISVARTAFVDVQLLYQPTSATDVSGGTFNIGVTQDHWTTSVTMTVNGSAVAPPVLDIVLVLDRSGSMAAAAGGYSSRSAAVADAADLFITLLGDGDKLGMVRFDDNYANPGDVLITMTAAGPMGSRTALRNALNGNPLAPGGSTSIGGGMALGMQVLEAEPNPLLAHKRSMVVMTDGHQNTFPDCPAASGSITNATRGVPRVFALGVGLDEIDQEFRDIVYNTHGFAYQTGVVVSDTRVQELFSKVLRNVTDADFADDPAVVVLPGQEGSASVAIGDADYQADFIILFGSNPPPSRLRAEIAIQAPNGTIFDATDIIAGTVPNMTGESRPSHIVLRCHLPAFAPPQANLGTWKIIVRNIARDVSKDMLKQDDGVVRCTLMTMVKSNLRLKGHLVHASQLPGQPFDIVAEPTLYGAPVKLASNATARVTRPDGVVRLITLTRDANLAYVGTATDTGLTGLYSVDIEAVAVSPAGITLKRDLQLQTVVQIPGQGPSTGDGEASEGGSYTTPPRRPSLWCRFWRAFFCLDCGRASSRCRCRC